MSQACMNEQNNYGRFNSFRFVVSKKVCTLQNCRKSKRENKSFQWNQTWNGGREAKIAWLTKRRCQNKTNISEMMSFEINSSAIVISMRNIIAKNDLNFGRDGYIARIMAFKLGTSLDSIHMQIIFSQKDMSNFLYRNNPPTNEYIRELNLIHVLLCWLWEKTVDWFLGHEIKLPWTLKTLSPTSTDVIALRYFL